VILFPVQQAYVALSIIIVERGLTTVNWAPVQVELEELAQQANVAASTGSVGLEMGTVQPLHLLQSTVAQEGLVLPGCVVLSGATAGQVLRIAVREYCKFGGRRNKHRREKIFDL